MKPTTVTISSLTPMRGIAALLVAVFHFDAILGKFVTLDQTMFVRKCYMMVDLFFIMSGFIIMHVYKENFAATINAQSFKKFILARFARIYPLHFFTLLFIVAVFYLSSSPPSPVQDPAAIPTNLLLLHSFGIHKIFTWNVPSWSISAEFWAYMVFPLLCLFLFRKRKIAIFSMSLFIILAYVSIMYLLPRHSLFDPTAPAPHDLDVTFDYGFLRGLAGFMTGMLMYLLYQNTSVRALWGRDFVSIACIILLGITMHFGVPDIVYIFLMAGLILSVSANRNLVAKALNNRLFQFLGNISYSIYLLHTIILFLIFGIIYKSGTNYKGPVVFPFFTGIIYCLGYLLIVVAVSTLTYYTIEKPCRKWINRKWAKREVVPVILQAT